MHAPESSTPVILLAYYYPPSNLSGAARPARFAKFLPEYGLTPAVVSASDAQRSGGFVRFLSFCWWLVQRVALPVNENLPWLPHGIHHAGRICRLNNAAVLFSTSPPIVTHLAALLLKRKYGVRWVADFRDPMAHNPFRTSRRAAFYLSRLEAAILREADVVIANTDGLKQMLQAHYPQHADKVKVIWNGFDPTEKLAAAPLPMRPYRVISHVGSLYGGRHPGVLLSSLERLLGCHAIEPHSIRVKLIGVISEMSLSTTEAPFSTLVESGYVEANNRNVPLVEARRIMAESDYLLLIDLNESQMDVQVPAKLFEYIQIGRPILCFTKRHSPTDEILKRAGIPYRCIYSDDSAAAIDEAVLSFFSLPTDPVKPSAWFLNEFDGRMQASVLAELCRPVAVAAGGVTQ